MSEKSELLLNLSVLTDFRNTINSSPIFVNSEKHCHRYNLICTVMDRIDSAVKVLNEYGEQPKSEESFIMFLVYACMLKDGIYKLYENVFHKKPPCVDSSRYLSNVCKYSEAVFQNDDCPTDDVLFEYLRAMAFAHPYDTNHRNRRSFLDTGENHCCPWVIVSTPPILKIKNPVGIRIYSNKKEDGMTDVYISFDDLKAYVKSRYDLLANLNNWAILAVQEQNSEWIKSKINRNLSPIEILIEIDNILEERFDENYGIKTAIIDLNCTLSLEENNRSVEQYRNAIVSIVPELCDAIDCLDHEQIDKLIGKVVYSCPKTMHKMGYYQLEKIFSYLYVRSTEIDPLSNESWGLKQAHAFSQGFAKEWVTIDVNTMSYDEIKLLVRTACYLENMRQSGEKE
ncbi:MAG: hypothetical protein KBS82_03350 [Oscillospiraceae bacterium]|nr:hypothetical protein [Candidatus Limimonas egerieequi]